MHIDTGSVYVQPVRRGQHQGGQPARMGQWVRVCALRRLPRHPQAHRRARARAVWNRTRAALRAPGQPCMRESWISDAVDSSKTALHSPDMEQRHKAPARVQTI